MYCRNCGANVDLNTEVCHSCGHRPLDGTKFCQECGKPTAENQVFCVNCQSDLKFGNRNNQQNNNYQQPNYQQQPVKAPVVDEPNMLANLGTLCCTPLIGIILYFVWKDTKPKAAKSVCYFTIAGVGISVLFVIIYFVFIAAALANATTDLTEFTY